MLFKKKNIFIIICLLLLILTSCSTQFTPGISSNPVSKSSFMLGTQISITIYDKQDEAIIDKALKRIKEIETKMTINNADTSEIIALNNASGSSEVKLSPDTFDVLERGKEFSEMTKGRFDITIGSIVKLWNIGTEYAAIPEPDILEQKKKLVDYTKLHLDRSKLTARLDDKGMQVDLGAIAKGYAADEAAKVLKENGVEHAIINLGGNILTIGGNTKDNPWKIGIQDPFNPRGDYIGIIQVTNKTVVTSGTYERYFEQNGKKYHHILDPRTGYPVDNDIASVSIITEKSIDGDGNSTSVLLLGLEEGLKLIENQKDVEAIFITYDKKVYVTSGIKDTFNITNKEFELID